MRNGNSYLARELVDKALYTIKLKQIEKYNKAKDEAERKEIETNPMKIFLNGLDNTKPILKLVGVVKGGISYQVPVPMSEKEREFKATNMVISSSNEKDDNVRFYDKLSQEMIDAFQNQVKFFLFIFVNINFNSAIRVRVLKRKLKFTNWQKLIEHTPTTNGPNNFVYLYRYIFLV